MAYFEDVYDSVLPHRAGSSGQCWPGINRIADDLKLSRSTVKRALADLEAAGRVTREARFRDNGGQSSWLFRLQI